MSEQYSVREARASFSDLIRRAEGGERIVITRDGRPVAALGPPPAELRPPASRNEAIERQRKIDGILGRVATRSKKGG